MAYLWPLARHSLNVISQHLGRYIRHGIVTLVSEDCCYLATTNKREKAFFGTLRNLWQALPLRNHCYHDNNAYYGGQSPHLFSMFNVLSSHHHVEYHHQYKADGKANGAEVAVFPL